MPLGTEVGFGPGYIVLDGAEPPNFWPTSVVAKRLDGLRCHLVTAIGLGPGHIVLDGVPAPRERGTVVPPFRSMSVVATVAHLSYC